MIGKTLGHYQISSQLGKGGMGEVYQAKDLKLGRDVAIKVLPEEFAKDADRVARFQREAKLLASLNHPNIAAIYGLEESGGTNFLILELVEGDTLADQIKRSPIPVEESLKLALQIAAALEAAHEKGVIHRDLKPANIKVTPDGKVKVLDFGLAKAFAEDQRDVTLSNSPTLSDIATQQGLILGTAAYMSPEQARGKFVDKRTDIWAFGCVLYEMLTGERAFEGETATETLAAILKSEPNWDALPAAIPPNVHFVLHRCLDKNKSSRFYCVGDLRIIIEEARDIPIQQAVKPVARSAWKTAALILLCLILGAAIAGAAFWSLRVPVPAKITRFSFVLPEGQFFTSTMNYLVAISPDGASFTYVADSQLYLRRMSETESRPIAGTNTDARAPFFSPDGQWIGFFSNQEMTLKKIAISGGVAVPLCKTSNPPWGARWQGNTILLGMRHEGILAVPESGGTPEVWVKPETGEQTSSPQFLPGGDVVLFAVVKAATGVTSDAWDSADIVAYSRKTGKRTVLVRGGRSPRYLSTGHIIYAVGTNLFAVSFDHVRLKVTGDRFPIVEGVMPSTGVGGGAANFSLADDGTLVYIPSRAVSNVNTDLRVLALVDRDGRREMLGLPPGSYDYPRLSRDGKQLAVVTSDAGGTIWVYDMSGKSALHQLTFEGTNSFPVWSPDGRWLAFSSNRENKPGIFLQRADGSGAAERLTNVPGAESYIPDAWSPDGKYLSFHATKTLGDTALWVVALTGERKAELFLDEPHSIEGHGVFSPEEGSYLAYMSGISGYRIYVQPFPKMGTARYPISQETSVAPLWSPNSKELFYYRVISEKLLAVPIQIQPAFSHGKPVPLPVDGMIQGSSPRRYDIMPDGKRFLVLLPAAQNEEQPRPIQQVIAVLNWFEELKQQVPVK